MYLDFLAPISANTEEMQFLDGQLVNCDPKHKIFCLTLGVCRYNKERSYKTKGTDKNDRTVWNKTQKRQR